MQVVIGNKLAINLINSKSYWFDGCLIRTVKIYGFYPSCKARKRRKITHRFETDWDWTTKLELKDYHIRFTGLKLYRNQFELCECGCVRVCIDVDVIYGQSIIRILNRNDMWSMTLLLEFKFMAAEYRNGKQLIAKIHGYKIKSEKRKKTTTSTKPVK